MPLSRCSCSHVYVNPQLTRDELEPFYRADYHQFRHATMTAEEITRDVRDFRGGRFTHVTITPGGRYLDVGCGLGDMVAKVGALGMRAEGVEVSEVAVAIARARGLEVFHGRLQDAGFPDASFDALSMFHVLEHIHDPVDLLRACGPLLKPDGELLVVVPNIDCTLSRMLKDKWFHVDVPRHLHHFTPESLRAASGRAGLEVAELVTESLDWATEGELAYWLRQRFFIPARVVMASGVLKPFARRLVARMNATGRGDVIIAHLKRPAAGRPA